MSMTNRFNEEMARLPLEMISIFCDADDRTCLQSGQDAALLMADLICSALTGMPPRLEMMKGFTVGYIIEVYERDVKPYEIHMA